MALASFGEPRYVADFCLGQACSGPSCQRHADLLQASTQVVRAPPGHRDEFPPHLHFGIEVGAQWVNPYPTLVSLYAATVGSTDQWQAELDRLAATADYNWVVTNFNKSGPLPLG